MKEWNLFENIQGILNEKLALEQNYSKKGVKEFYQKIELQTQHEESLFFYFYQGLIAKIQNKSIFSKEYSTIPIELITQLKQVADSSTLEEFITLVRKVNTKYALDFENTTQFLSIKIKEHFMESKRKKMCQEILKSYDRFCKTHYNHSIPDFVSDFNNQASISCKHLYLLPENQKFTLDESLFREMFSVFEEEQLSTRLPYLLSECNVFLKDHKEFQYRLKEPQKKDALRKEDIEEFDEKIELIPLYLGQTEKELATFFFEEPEKQQQFLEYVTWYQQTHHPLENSLSLLYKEDWVKARKLLLVCEIEREIDKRNAGLILPETLLKPLINKSIKKYCSFQPKQKPLFYETEIKNDLKQRRQEKIERQAWSFLQTVAENLQNSTIPIHKTLVSFNYNTFDFSKTLTYLQQECPELKQELEKLRTMIQKEKSSPLARKENKGTSPSLNDMGDPKRIQKKKLLGVFLSHHEDSVIFLKEKQIDSTDFYNYRRAVLSKEEFDEDKWKRITIAETTLLKQIEEMTPSIALEIQQCKKDQVPYDLYDHYQNHQYSLHFIKEILRITKKQELEKDIIERYLVENAKYFKILTPPDINGLKMRTSFYLDENTAISYTLPQLTRSLSNIEKENLPMCYGVVLSALQREKGNKEKVKSRKKEN